MKIYVCRYCWGVFWYQFKVKEHTKEEHGNAKLHYTVYDIKKRNTYKR